MEQLIKPEETYSRFEKYLIIFIVALIVSVIIVSIVMGFYVSFMTIE